MRGAIVEPPMTGEDRKDFRHGIALFNAGRFWHAHEAWEAVWRRQRAHPAQLFFKGLIQLAAAHHQRERGRFDGMLIHFGRARAKLIPFAPEFLGVDVASLLSSIAAGEAEARRVGPECLADFARTLVPR